MLVRTRFHQELSCDSYVLFFAFARDAAASVTSFFSTWLQKCSTVVSKTSRPKNRELVILYGAGQKAAQSLLSCADLLRRCCQKEESSRA